MKLQRYNIIERLRNRRGLTYKQLAAEIGLSRQALYNIMTGRSKPYPRNQLKLERWLNGQKM